MGQCLLDCNETLWFNVIMLFKVWTLWFDWEIKEILFHNIN